MGNTPGAIANYRVPMRIHKHHGSHLNISQDRLTATRFKGYCDAMIFGTRPVLPEEKIEVVVKKVISEWNGSIRYGFTIHDPEDLVKHPEGMPRYVCPDLLKRGGCFVDTFSTYKFKDGDIIHFWVTRENDVRIRINNMGQSHNLKKVPGPVWPVVDIYGNCSEITFCSQQEDYVANSYSSVPRFYTSLNLAELPVSVNPDSVDLIDNCIAKRRTLEKPFAWNKLPLRRNQIWAVFVKECEENKEGSLSIAVVTTNPASINPLPDHLLGFNNNNNGFKLYNEIYNRMNVSDEIAICILEEGQVMVAINGGKFEKIDRAPVCQNYWIIADMNCPIISLQSIGVFNMNRQKLPPMPRNVDLKSIEKCEEMPRYNAQLTSPPTLSASNNAQPSPVTPSQPPPPSIAAPVVAASASNVDGEDEEFQKACAESLKYYSLEQQRHGAAGGGGDTLLAQDTLVAQPASVESSNVEERPATPQVQPVVRHDFLKDSECIICMDNTPDNAFIPCGHLVTCSPCAENMRNEHANNKCPTCRNRIDEYVRVNL